MLLILVCSFLISNLVQMIFSQSLVQREMFVLLSVIVFSMKAYSAFVCLLTESINVINLLFSAFFANFCSRSTELYFAFRLGRLCPVVNSSALLTRVT